MRYDKFVSYLTLGRRVKISHCPTIFFMIKLGLRLHVFLAVIFGFVVVQWTLNMLLIHNQPIQVTDQDKKGEAEPKIESLQSKSTTSRMSFVPFFKKADKWTLYADRVTCYLAHT